MKLTDYNAILHKITSERHASQLRMADSLEEIPSANPFADLAKKSLLRTLTNEERDHLVLFTLKLFEEHARPLACKETMHWCISGSSVVARDPSKASDVDVFVSFGLNSHHAKVPDPATPDFPCFEYLEAYPNMKHPWRGIEEYFEDIPLFQAFYNAMKLALSSHADGPDSDVWADNYARNEEGPDAVQHRPTLGRDYEFRCCRGGAINVVLCDHPFYSAAVKATEFGARVGIDDKKDRIALFDLARFNPRASGLFEYDPGTPHTPKCEQTLENLAAMAARVRGASKQTTEQERT